MMLEIKVFLDISILEVERAHLHLKDLVLYGFKLIRNFWFILAPS
jgi:hypothetical protein